MADARPVVNGILQIEQDIIDLSMVALIFVVQQDDGKLEIEWVYFLMSGKVHGKSKMAAINRK